MIDILNRKKQSVNITIEIDDDKLFINGKNIELPIDINHLFEFFGQPTKEIENEIYWEDLGISTMTRSTGLTGHLTLYTSHAPTQYTPEDEQKPLFKGEIIVDGVEIGRKRFDNITRRKYEVSQFTYTGEKYPCFITISYNEDFDKDFVKPTLTKDKYVIKELDEEVIEFKDFGFKLSIIQELMYDKELLKPKFDLYEFVEWYDKRKIDIEEEGYEPIPEVTQWFRDLPVPKKYAPEITRIYQDGGSYFVLRKR